MTDDFDLIDDETKPVKDDTPATLEQFPDGVYLHMPEQTYHSQHRLSSSGIGKLRVSEADFWKASWLNPDRVDKPTDAQFFGRIFHVAKLEPHKLDKIYIRDLNAQDMDADCLFTDADVKDAIKAMIPTPDQHPDALRTDTDVKNFLADIGEQKTVSGETPDDRKLRLRQHSASAVFWSDVVAEWEAEHGPISAPSGETARERAYRLKSYGYKGQIWQVERDNFESSLDGRIPVPHKIWDQIKSDVAEMHEMPVIQKYLTGGLAEVSILWTDADGNRWKARLDYLRPDIFTDAKTFVNQMGKPVLECLYSAFRYNGYYIQAQIYRNAVDQIRAGNVALMDAKTDEEQAIFQAVADRPYPLKCVYLFQQKEGVANVLAGTVHLDTLAQGMNAAESGATPEQIEFMANQYSIPSNLSKRATRDIDEAVDTFRTCMEMYGETEKWRPIKPEFDIDDEAFNPFWLDPEFSNGDIQ